MKPALPFRRGQLVMRRRDDVVLEVVALNGQGTRVLLSDGVWYPLDAVEDPLRESLRRDLERARARPRPERRWLFAAAGWSLALGEALVIAARALS